MLTTSAVAYPRPGATERISIGADGSEGNGRSGSPAISDGGRYVAFESFAGNLVPEGGGGVFLRDRQTGNITRVAVDGPTSGPFQGSSLNPSINADGRYLAFDSFHEVDHPDPPGGFTALRDIFVFDRESGIIEQVSVGSGGTLPNSFSTHATISADGRYVAFSSRATNLAPEEDTNDSFDVFVHDRVTTTTEMVSVASDGTQGNDGSGGSFSSVALSADGRYVAFDSFASNLVPEDANNTHDVFVHDRETGITERVSEAEDGSDGNSQSRRPSISADGRFVSFDSFAGNFVPAEDDGCNLPLGSCGEADVFVLDRETGTLERVSVGSAGLPGNHNSWAPSLSSDGRHVAFFSSASNLVAGDTNEVGDVFVHDRATGTTERVSVGSGGTEGNARSDGVFSSTNRPAFAGDARFIGFRSAASNLVANDTNGEEDVFVRDRGPLVGVGDLSAEPGTDGISVSGWATFSGEPVSSGEDPSDDGAPSAEESGGEITRASVIYRPEQEDLLVRLGLTSLPKPVIGTDGVRVCVPGALCVPTVRTDAGVGAPQVLYKIAFDVKGVHYEVRGVRQDGTDDENSAGARFAVYRCDPGCSEAGQLEGGLGTTGNEMRVSVPLEVVGAEEGDTLREIVASASIGSETSGSTETLDQIAMPDASVPRHRVQLSVTPTSTPEEDVPYTTEVDLVEGRFSAILDPSQLAAGDHRVWAKACLGDTCGIRSVEVSRDGNLIASTLELVTEAVRQDVMITAKLKETGSGLPISGAEISFYINDEFVESAVTDTAGEARITLHRSRFKPRDTLSAMFAGDGTYGASTATEPSS